MEEISKAVSRSVLLSSIWLPQKVGPSSAVVNFFRRGVFNLIIPIYTCFLVFRVLLLFFNLFVSL